MGCVLLLLLSSVRIFLSSSVLDDILLERGYDYIFIIIIFKNVNYFVLFGIIVGGMSLGGTWSLYPFL